jgi:hypothetical protein
VNIRRRLAEAGRLIVAEEGTRCPIAPDLAGRHCWRWYRCSAGEGNGSPRSGAKGF